MTGISSMILLLLANDEQALPVYHLQAFIHSWSSEIQLFSDAELSIKEYIILRVAFKSPFLCCTQYSTSTSILSNECLQRK